MKTNPTYGELLELLDDVSALAENVIAHFHPRNSADYAPRTAKVRQARVICDGLLRSSESDQETNV